MKKNLLVFCVIFLGACGQSLNGTYADSRGLVQYTFESNGKVTTQSSGIEAESRYELVGKKEKLLYPQSTLVLTLQDDDSIAGANGNAAHQEKITQAIKNTCRNLK